MLSICTSIYRETDSLEVFVRSVFGNASVPSEVEIVVANDEAYAPTTEVLNRLSLEFPNLKYFSRTKEQRIKFLKNTIKFYEREKIFTPEETLSMEVRVRQYEGRELDSIWFPPGKLFNKAVKMSCGDVLLFVPSDYICFGDLSKIYQAYKEVPGDVIGHFDWIDTTSLDPMPNVLEILRGLKTHGQFNETTLKWLQQAFANNVAHVWQQHGMRMVKRALFDATGGFDGRWFIRSWNDDCFNQKLQRHAEVHRLIDLGQTHSMNPYFGTLRGKTWKNPNYLCETYSGTPEVHNQFLSRIQFYLEREGT